MVSPEFHGHEDVEIGVRGGLTTGVGAEELQHHETFAKKAAHRSGERVERRSLLRGERPRGVHAVPFRKGGPSPVSRGMSMRTHPIPHPPRDPLFRLPSPAGPQCINATSAWQLGFTHPPRAALPPAVRIPRGRGSGHCSREGLVVRTDTTEVASSNTVPGRAGFLLPRIYDSCSRSYVRSYVQEESQLRAECQPVLVRGASEPSTGLAGAVARQES